jgi:hypothetical protein
MDAGYKILYTYILEVVEAAALAEGLGGGER